jgi:DNA-binding phage protein
MIEGCQGDVRTAKRVAEQQLIRLNAQSEKQELFGTELIAAELGMIFAKRNRAQIAEKSRQNTEELALFEEELQAKGSRAIAENAVEVGREIELLSSANQLARKEIARQRMLLEKEETFRVGQERRRQRTRDELESVKSSVSGLKDSLFELQAQGMVGVSVPEGSAENEQLRR